MDEFGPRPAFEALMETVAEPKSVMFIEAGDHFFAGSLERLEETLAATYSLYAA